MTKTEKALAVVHRMKFLCSDFRIANADRRRRGFKKLALGDAVSLEIVEKWADELEKILKGEPD